MEDTERLVEAIEHGLMGCLTYEDMAVMQDAGMNPNDYPEFNYWDDGF